jgi:hypothetical protein
MIFGLKFLKKFPLMAGGGMNRALVYSIFVSFIEDIDIDEFSKILRHGTFGNDKCFLLLVA